MSKSKSFWGFIGQSKTISYLTSQLHGAQALGQACPHIMVLGPSGMGKTKLIKALAQEAGVYCRVVHGKASQKDLCHELVQLQKGDFIFLDEAHTLPRESQEALYEVIDSNFLTNKASVGFLKTLPTQPKQTTDGKLIIPAITIALATNEPSALLAALVRRMELVVHIADYARGELMNIASQQAVKEGLLLGKRALNRIAIASLGQPGICIQIVKGMKRLYHADCHRMMASKDVVVYLKSTGKDNKGLGLEQRQYMKRLHKLGHASVATLASLLGLEVEYAEQKIEAGLVKLGLVYKGSGGRRLTREGEDWVRDLMERKLGKGNSLKRNFEKRNSKKEEKDE